MRARTLFCIGVSTLALLTATVFAVGKALPADTVPVVRTPLATSRVVLRSTSMAGLPIVEMSGLAWDADEGRLYAVSDQGYVYRFEVQRDDRNLVSLKPDFAARLINSSTAEGQAGSGRHFNAEGLTIRHAANGVRGDSELVVALEENPPQIARFSVTGAALGHLPVPPPADDMAHFKKKGRGLESVALHPIFGVMTAPETPLRGHQNDLHTVYAKDHAWSFPRRTAGSRLKGIEVMPDGSLLVLERSRHGSKNVQVASLRRVGLVSCRASGMCEGELVATLPAGPENFEGMTLLDAHHVLLASDNGDDITQGTTFVMVTLP